MDYQNLIDRQAVVVDVRSQAEFMHEHGEGSINIPLSELLNNIDKLKQLKKPIITCCRSGKRAQKATSILENAQIEAYNGGSWRGVQLSLIP